MCSIKLAPRLEEARAAIQRIAAEETFRLETKIFTGHLISPRPVLEVRVPFFSGLFVSLVPAFGRRFFHGVGGEGVYYIY